MNINHIAGVLIAVALIAYPTKGLQINMMENNANNKTPDSLNFGVNIDQLNYTVVVDDGIVRKIELNGPEEPEFVIKTEWDTLCTFIQDFHKMDWLDRANFIINKFHVPMNYMFDLAAMGIEE